MQKFHLKTSAIIKGDFKIKEMNLLLVFQVNCPGCFAHAFPLANEIYNSFHKKGLNVLGLATAFEDFEFNSQENTRLLIEKGALVGETKKFFENNNINKLPYLINFPVAFDQYGSGNELYVEDDAMRICQSHSFFSSLTKDEQTRSVQNVLQNLKGLPNSSYTFTINKLMGTPSWLIIDRDFYIINQWFGHIEKVELFKKLEELI